jgi:hypothetical protein
MKLTERMRISGASMGLMLLAAFCLLCTSPGMAQTAKEKTRHNYVLKQLKLDKTMQSKFSPLFYAYLKELKAAKDIYDKPKNQHKSLIDGNKLTEAQAKMLIDAHWKADGKELEVKKKYTPLFVGVIGQQKTYKMFRLANDKLK